MNLLADWQSNKNFSPGSPAVIYESNILSYAQLNDLINERAAALQSEGIFAGDFVALFQDHNIDFIINAFALWRTGAIPVPVNSRLIEKEITGLISFAGCKHLILDKSIDKKPDGGGYKVITNFNASRIDKLSLSIPSEDETAVIIFTSGSTGKPKGVELSFKNLIQSALIGNQFLDQNPNDRWLASLPFYHIGGFSIFVRAFLFGASVIIPDSLSAENLCKSLVTNKPTLASLVSTQLLRMIENGCKPNKELRNVLLGGGFIEKELINKAIGEGWNISKVYGSSETASMVTALLCKDDNKIDSAGKPLSGNEVIIVDNNNNQLPHNTSGEILVKSPSVAKGYIKNPDETSLKFRNGYYYSGDIGYLDEDGYLFVEARRTDLIISGGENINPIDVEKEILKHNNIVEAAVFAIDDKEWGQAVAAAIVTKNKTQITIEELKEYLKDKISGYKIPRKLFIVDELPKSPLGKIQREKLKKI